MTIARARLAVARPFSCSRVMVRPFAPRRTCLCSAQRRAGAAAREDMPYDTSEIPKRGETDSREFWIFEPTSPISGHVYVTPRRHRDRGGSTQGFTGKPANAPIFHEATYPMVFFKDVASRKVRPPLNQISHGCVKHVVKSARPNPAQAPY